MPFANSGGNAILLIVCLEINSTGLQIMSPHIFIRLILRLSLRWALFELRFAITFSILSAAKLISVTFLGFIGSLLQLFNKEHWLEEKELKSKAFFSKSVIKRFS